jgi:predicted glycogen debranching enzyme
MRTMLSELKDGLFPNLGQGKNASYNSVDASLWFFWALQQYKLFNNSATDLWKDYGKYMRSIISHYKEGTHNGIKMHDNGLLWSGEKGKALTWMDAVVHGKPVTARTGYAVEINALWYNAVCFALELAKEANSKRFIKEWESFPETFRKSFKELFWSDEKMYLADYVNNGYKDWAVRPNMIFTVSLPYSPVGPFIKDAILSIVKQELLTPRGLRTLSPKNRDYKGVYFGNQEERDNAYHQGTVWPWLIGAFAESYLKLYGKNGISFIESIFAGFEEVMDEAGIGTISEVYDGDPPHKAGGAISQAWNIAELMRIRWILDHFNQYMQHAEAITTKEQSL